MNELIFKILELNNISPNAKTSSGQTAAEVLESYIENALDIIEKTEEEG